MVSFKSLTLLTLSISAAVAYPSHGHARLHHRAADTVADAGQPSGTGDAQPSGKDECHHHHHHHHNGTETGDMKPTGMLAARDGDDDKKESCTGTHTEFATSTQVVTVTAQRRWDHTRTWTWGGSSDAATPAATVPAASGSSPTSAGSAPASTGTSSADGKKGLSYNSISLLSQFTDSGAVWTYNWGASAGGTVPSGLEYVPMLWGESGISAWSGAVSTAISDGATHVLSFNEPDFPAQANIDAATAAKLHIANVASLSGKVQIGSPAVSNSNIAGQGLDWLTSFLAACGGTANNCKLDFVAYHWYNNPGTLSDLQAHTQAVINLAATNGIKKVWLTEFGLNGGTEDDQTTFLAEALPYLDSTAAVERYAYFMVGNGELTTNNVINAVGKAYSS